MGLIAKSSGRSVRLNWKSIPLERVLAYRVFRTLNASQAPVEVGSTSSPTFTDENVEQGQYQYSVSAAFLPHSGAEYEKRLGSALAHFGPMMAKTAKLYEGGRKSATHGFPITDEETIKEIQKAESGKVGIAPLELPGLLLQTAPSKPVSVAIQ